MRWIHGNDRICHRSRKLPVVRAYLRHAEIIQIKGQGSVQTFVKYIHSYIHSQRYISYLNNIRNHPLKEAFK